MSEVTFLMLLTTLLPIGLWTIANAKSCQPNIDLETNPTPSQEVLAIRSIVFYKTVGFLLTIVGTASLILLFFTI